MKHMKYMKYMKIKLLLSLALVQWGFGKEL